MTRGRAQISALLLGFLLAALPASVVAGTPPPEACLIPLESGTRWVYEADVRWTPVAGEKGTQRPGIQSARLRWTNEAVRAHRLSLKSGPPNRDVTSYVIAYRTNPDHQLLELTPGIGFTRLEYEHHGTVGEEKVRLIDFIPRIPERIQASGGLKSQQ